MQPGMLDRLSLDEARNVAHPWWREHAATLNGGTIAYSHCAGRVTFTVSIPLAA